MSAGARGVRFRQVPPSSLAAQDGNVGAIVITQTRVGPGGRPDVERRICAAAPRLCVGGAWPLARAPPPWMLPAPNLCTPTRAVEGCPQWNCNRGGKSSPALTCSAGVGALLQVCQHVSVAVCAVCCLLQPGCHQPLLLPRRRRARRRPCHGILASKAPLQRRLLARGRPLIALPPCVVLHPVGPHFSDRSQPPPPAALTSPISFFSDDDDDSPMMMMMMMIIRMRRARSSCQSWAAGPAAVAGSFLSSGRPQQTSALHKRIYQEIRGRRSMGARQVPFSERRVTRISSFVVES